MIKTESLEVLRKLIYEDEDHFMWSLVTALRGPDSEDYQKTLKSYITAKLRGVILNLKDVCFPQSLATYSANGGYQYNNRTEGLTSLETKMLGVALSHANAHFVNHAKQAFKFMSDFVDVSDKFFFDVKSCL